MSSSSDETKGVRSVLQRASSGRSEETTFDYEENTQDQAKDEVKLSKEQLRALSEKRSTSEILQAAGKRALGGGLPVRILGSLMTSLGVT